MSNSLQEYINNIYDKEIDINEYVPKTRGSKPIPIEIDGIKYHSISDAVKVTGISEHNIRSAIKSNKTTINKVIKETFSFKTLD